MPKRVSPIETIRADIDTVSGSGKAIEECLEELMRHSVRLVLQQVLKNDLEVFQNRDLTSIDLDYPFLDGSHFKMHDGTNAEPVMVAYAITTVSQPVLVAVEPAATESNAASTRSLTATTKPSRLRCAARKTTVKR